MATLILGNGFTAKYFSQISDSELFVAGNNTADPIYFDFYDEATWNNLPEADSCLITLKLTDPDLAQKLYEQKLKNCQKIILISSAGIFKNEEVDGVISERSEIDEDSDRANAESVLINHGAIRICPGLIYGHERSLRDWLKQGRIKNARKIINLIHVKDLCRIIHLLFSKTPEEKTLLVSDNNPLRWQELADFFKVAVPSSNPGLESKRIDSSTIRKYLPEDFVFINPKCEEN